MSMLRISEQWFGSDVGRQRQGNEDNFFVRAPLYVVADGMGGAQAGEVASALAVEAFEPGLGDGAPEEALTEIIRAANRRIHEMSRSDRERSGMGTTCTAAYVAADEVVIAHVGDSRAYLWRRGELTRLTRDHSLVGELVDRGKLTEEQAEMHPQRSVITRALGPEADVRVDTERVQASDGDVFLLCSDGLTSMIREPRVVEALEGARSLEDAGRQLIAAANAAGGRDNITVVLFRVEQIDGAPGDDQATVEAGALRAEPEDEYDTFEGEAVPGPRQGVTRMSAATRAGEAAPAAAAAAPRATDGQEAAYRRDATVALQAIERSEAAPASSTAPPPPPVRTAAGPAATRRDEPKRRRLRPPVWLIGTLVLLAIVLFSGWIATRAVFFLGTDGNGAVTVYRGLPYELPLGVDLYSRHYTSGVTLDQVPAGRRSAFTDHELRSLDDAQDLVRQLETGRLEP